MKIKKVILLIVALLPLSIIGYKIHTHIIFNRIQKLMVDAACDKGELDNYFNVTHVHNSAVIYERVKTLFPAYKLKESHITKLGKGGNKDMYNVAKKMGQAIYDQCGTPKRTIQQARMFVSQMIQRSKPNQ